MCGPGRYPPPEALGAVVDRQHPAPAPATLVRSTGSPRTDLAATDLRNDTSTPNADDRPPAVATLMERR